MTAVPREFSPDTARLKMRAKAVALGDADNELIVAVRAIGQSGRQRYGAFKIGLLEEPFVAFGIPPPGGGPAIQVRKLHAENRGLKGMNCALGSSSGTVCVDINTQ